MKIGLIVVFTVMVLSGCAQNAAIENTSRHYVVVDVTISDVEKYNKFIELEKPILKRFDSFIGLDIRNSDQKRRYLVISFPDRDTVSRFVKSNEFQKILPLNKQSAKSTLFHGKLYE